MQSIEWELSASLSSDGQGIRCVCVLPLDDDNKESMQEDSDDKEPTTMRLLTGSQAGSLVLYSLPSCSMTSQGLHQHNHAVTALLSVDLSNSSRSSLSSLYVTGCKDSIVRVFNASTHALVKELIGHDKAVTSLAVGRLKSSGSCYLISGSWDGTAKVWSLDNYSLLATLPNHENSVCVAALEAEDVITTSTTTTSVDANLLLYIATGSAGVVSPNNLITGHAVRLWTVNTQSGQVTLQQHVANDHDGPIRDLCRLPLHIDSSSGSSNTLLASCSNDGTVKLREPSSGRPTCTLSFLHQQQQQQAPMLLSVAPIADDSLAASAEDGLVVVWNVQQPQQEPQLIPHASSVWTVLGMPNGDMATCCQDGSLRLFTRSLDRMAADGIRQEFASKVQAALQKQTSGPSAEEVAKLPLWQDNLRKQGSSEGQVQLFQKDGIAIAAQWSAVSQTWIEVGQVMGNAGNDGDSNIIDGVAYDYVFPIEVDQPSQPGGVASLSIGYNNGENPFVTAQRFIDAHVLPQYHLTQIADYITQRANQGGGVTLGSATTAPAAAVATTGMPIASFQYLPMKTYKVFDLSEKQAATTMEKMKVKIQGFQKLSDDQLATVSALMNVLQATSRYHASEISDSQLEVLAYMLETFPPEEAFPALDLARMAVLHSDAARQGRTIYWKRVVQLAIQLCQRADKEGVQGPAAVGIPLLSLRLFANAFKGGPGSLEAVVSNLQPVLDCCQPHVKSGNKTIRLSLTTLVGNMCFCLSSATQAGTPIVFPPDLISVIDIILSNYNLYDSDAILRTLVGLGTLVMAVPDAKSAAQSIFLLVKVQPAASPHGEDAKNAAREVYSVLS
jgi:phospholipase A-2-activating protein